MSDSTLLHKEWYAWIGRRVCVSKGDAGTLKYFGEIRSKEGLWCGVEYDEPIGNTDGMINNVQYFTCKANHGLFVPMYEVARIRSRSIELRRLSDLSKFRLDGDCFGDDKITRMKKYGKLGKTCDMNENKNIPDTSCHKNSKAENKHTDFIMDKKHVNVVKRSKNSCRFGTEESLGILSNLLDEDESWNLLDCSDEKSLIQKINYENEDDYVFSPPAKLLLPSSIKLLGHIDNPIQNYFDLKCTSTPKNCLNNICDLGATINLDHNQSYDLFHEEIEPIIAGSSGPKSMDFDLTKFKHNEILCSTSKLSIPVLPTELSLLDTLCMEKEEFMKSIRNNEDQLSIKTKDRNNLASSVPIVSNECQYSNVQRMPKSLDILNVTYETIPTFSNSPTLPNVIDLSQNFGFESNTCNSNIKSNVITDLNSTFVLHNSSESAPICEEICRTFVIDRSPVNAIERNLSAESEINFEKKSLSIIFEKASNENLSNVGVEYADVAHSKDISSLKPDGITNLVNSNHSSENIGKFEVSLNSTLNTADKAQIINLNSTFCISSDESKGKNSAVSHEANKRYSLSAISVKNNLPVHKEKTNIVSHKPIKEPQLFSTQKTVFKVPKSHVASTTVKTKITKNSTVINSLNKKVDVPAKNVSKDSSLKSFSKLSSKDNMKTKCSSSIANVTEQFKKTLESCKALCQQTKQENASHVALKITEKSTKITSRRKSVGGLESKVVSKISYTSNKISISEHENVNPKVSNGTDYDGLISKNIDDKKHSSIKRRHTMLPIVRSNGTQAKWSLAKSKSDVSNSTSTVAAPSNIYSSSECVQSSKTPQDSIEDKKENIRESPIKKPAPVKKIVENSKDIPKFGNKQNENLTIPKRQLLKPGMLSRLPVPEKSIKKPGFISKAVEPQHSIKNINQVGKQRINKRLPLRKLQDQS